MQDVLASAKSAQLRSALVLDSDAPFYQMLEDDPVWEAARPLVVTGGSAFRQICKDQEFSFKQVFLSAQLLNPSVARAVVLARKAFPTASIFITHDELRAPLPESECKKIGIEGVIHRSKICGHLVPLPENLASESGQDSKVIAREFDIPKEYIPVTMDEFFGASPSLFDVHLQIAESHFVKLINAGEHFAPERWRHYKSLGVKRLLIQRGVHEKLLMHCEGFANQLLQNAAISASMKVSHLLGRAEEVMDAVGSKNAPSQVDLQEGMECIDALFEFLDKTKITDGQLVQILLDRVAMLHRAVLATLISVLLARSLEIQSQDSLMQIGMASLFQDIGTVGLSGAELTEHPIKSAELLRNIGGLSDLCLQVVAEHHERRDNRGYPRGIPPGSIHLFSEIIGIGDEFISAMESVGPYADKIEEVLTSRAYSGYSIEVVGAVKRLLGMI